MDNDDLLKRRYKNCVEASDREIEEIFSRPKGSSTVLDRLSDFAERSYFGETLEAYQLRTWKRHGEEMCRKDYEWAVRMSRC